MQIDANATGLGQAVKNIYSSQGIKGFYAGLSAAYLRQWMYGSFRMGIYSELYNRKKVECAAKGGKPSFVDGLLIGSFSGAVGSFIGNPTEVALVRMGADAKAPLTERRNYKSVFDVIARVTKDEGPLKLWRGAVPTVLRASVMSSILMSSASQLKVYFNNTYQMPENGIPNMFISTLIGSFFANVGCMPFDVAKSRIQNMQIVPGEAPMYR